MFKTPSQGSSTTLWAATAPLARYVGVNAHARRIGQRMWTVSEALLAEP